MGKKPLRRRPLTDEERIEAMCALDEELVRTKRVLEDDVSRAMAAAQWGSPAPHPTTYGGTVSNAIYQMANAYPPSHTPGMLGAYGEMVFDDGAGWVTVPGQARWVAHVKNIDGLVALRQDPRDGGASWVGTPADAIKLAEAIMDAATKAQDHGGDA